VIAETTFKALPAVRLYDDWVRLTIIPAWGGKVAELFDLRRHREWLFVNPALPYRLPEYGASYVQDFDLGGFDECFPTVGDCAYPIGPWKGTPLPDHGEVWSIPWRARQEGESLRLTTYGVRLPYRLEKSIRLLGEGRTRFDYRATNLTPFPMPFLWSSHPLLALRPGMRLHLPVTEMSVYDASSAPDCRGDTIAWPRFEDRDLSQVPEPDAGVAVKLFPPPLSEGWAELCDPADSARFRFEFDPRLVTHLGVWINYGGWAGVPRAEPYFNLGLEPCIGAPDRLDTAVHQWGAYGQLPPGGRLEWWLRISVA
jgi:galactose mutarotase-like enzyme